MEKKKVLVKIVDKYRSGFNRNSDGNTIWTGSKRMYQLPTNQYDRLIPVLTEEERKELEEALNLAAGSLLTNARNNNYWREFKVTLDKNGRVLDLSDPEDFLAYKVLSKTNSIAKSKDDINVLVHDFYMVTEEQEQEADNKLTDRYEEANNLYSKISKSDKNMTNVLRLLGRKIAPDANSKWLRSELVKIINQREVLAGVKGMDDFIAVAKDPNFDIKVIIIDALEIGEIFIEGTSYKLRSGDTIGLDLDQAITFMKSPKNQATRLLIEERIKSNK